MRFATQSDVIEVAQLLKAMYLELTPDDIKDDDILFKKLAYSHLDNDYVILDNRGFFIMKDETPIVKKTTIWNGVAVYIKPEYRNTKALKEFYAFMFNNFKGSIMGYTEINSNHNKVLLKRHKLLGFVYELNRN